MRSALMVTAAVAALAIVVSATSAARSPCLGAASRDPLHPCHDRRLDRSVTPSVSVAQITPNAPCTPIERDGPPTSFAGGIEVCAFGVPPERAVATVALIGDSHAMTWRAALEVVAQAKGWRALSITRGRCALSRATVKVAEPERTGCRRWNERVTRWLGEHPEVGVVFVAGRSTTPVVTRRGQRPFAAKAAGYHEAWHALPPSVRHIVVLRDNPRVRVDTFGCIRRALAAHRPPGPACALPRARVLGPDPALAAAARSRSRRLQTIDLARFMCDRRRCYPVVGGVLVDKDGTHLSAAFAATLGPFLLRRLDTLMEAWASR
jgi:hypothetical protein